MPDNNFISNNSSSMSAINVSNATNTRKLLLFVDEKCCKHFYVINAECNSMKFNFLRKRLKKERKKHEVLQQIKVAILKKPLEDMLSLCFFFGTKTL